ncbi:MAG: esterase-like activity of phytase family protein, partial [Pseudomonadota bacterium]
MTYASPLRTVLVTLALCVFPGALSAQEYEDIYVEALTLPLNAEDPEETDVGELLYRGGLKILPGADDILPSDDKIGRISSLEWHDDALWAVADDGRWMRIRTDEDDARLLDIVSMDIGALRDLRGRKPRDKDDIDAEALTLNPQGDWMVAFEQDHRVWRYQDLTGPALDEGQGPLSVFGPMIANRGIETMAGGPDGGLLCAERHTPGEANCARINGRQVAMFELVPPPELAAFGSGPVPTDAACAGDGVCYTLVKAFDSSQLTGKAIKAAVIEVQPDNSQRTLA